MSRAHENLQYTVEEWAPDNSSIIEVLARVGNLSVAYAAYWAALAARPKRRIVLRQKALELAARDLSDEQRSRFVQDVFEEVGQEAVTGSFRQIPQPFALQDDRVQRLASLLWCHRFHGELPAGSDSDVIVSPQGARCTLRCRS